MSVSHIPLYFQTNSRSLVDLNRPTIFNILNDRNKDLLKNTLVRHWPATTKDVSVVMFNKLMTFNHNSSDGGGKMLNNNTGINTGRLNVMYREERLMFASNDPIEQWLLPLGSSCLRYEDMSSRINTHAQLSVKLCLLAVFPVDILCTENCYGCSPRRSSVFKIGLVKQTRETLGCLTFQFKSGKMQCHPFPVDVAVQ